MTVRDLLIELEGKDLNAQVVVGSPVTTTDGRQVVTPATGALMARTAVTHDEQSRPVMVIYIDAPLAPPAPAPALAGA